MSKISDWFMDPYHFLLSFVAFCILVLILTIIAPNNRTYRENLGNQGYYICNQSHGWFRTDKNLDCMFWPYQVERK